ncbi:hypothetical protein ACFX2C_046968 [Malus domestica]
MSDPSSTAGNGNSNGNSNDNSVTKTAGLVVNEQTPPLAESTQPIQLPSQLPLPPQQQPITVKEPHPPLRKTITRMDQNVEVTRKSWHKTIEIEKGDTLWGLSREHGEIQPVDAIKEVNGLTGDTIYAGKKLIIP